MSTIAFHTYRDIYTFLRTEILDKLIDFGNRNSCSLLVYNSIINIAQVKNSVLRDDMALMTFLKKIMCDLDQRLADSENNHAMFLFKHCEWLDSIITWPECTSSVDLNEIFDQHTGAAPSLLKSNRPTNDGYSETASLKRTYSCSDDQTIAPSNSTSTSDVSAPKIGRLNSTSMSIDESPVGPSNTVPMSIDENALNIGPSTAIAASALKVPPSNSKYTATTPFRINLPKSSLASTKYDNAVPSTSKSTVADEINLKTEASSSAEKLSFKKDDYRFGDYRAIYNFLKDEADGDMDVALQSYENFYKYIISHVPNEVPPEDLITILNFSQEVSDEMRIGFIANEKNEKNFLKHYDWWLGLQVHWPKCNSVNLNHIFGRYGRPLPAFKNLLLLIQEDIHRANHQ